MSTARVDIAIVLGVAMLAASPGDGSAQESVVHGVVYDSIAEAPLSDAAVFLWDTPYRAVSDAEGRYRITGIPPGDYNVLFFHARLGEMAVSPGPVPITLQGSESVEIDLATPSMFTLLSSECLMEAIEPNTGSIAGWVGDGASGMGLPGAHVTLSWENEEGRVERMEANTDAGGWYRICLVPSGKIMSAHVTFFDRESLRREVEVGEYGATQASFMVGTQEPADINGRLIDAETLAPVGNAEVWLRGRSEHVLSDDEGIFHFDDVPPGQYMLMTDHLAYGVKMDTLDVPSAQNISVEMRLDTRAIDIAPLTVTVDSRPITERAMGGIQIPRAKVDEVRHLSRDAADVLRSQHIPGVIVRRRGDGSMCIGYSSGQVRMLNNGSGGCQPMMIFINGAKASNSTLALQMPPESIDRMVVYRPVEAGNLFGFGASNGVLMIYTKGN